MFSGMLPPTSNRATWSESYELRDSETNDLIDLSAVDEITLNVRDIDSKSNVLSGTLSGGEIEVVEDGVFQWRFEASSMRSLCAKTYEVGIVIEQDDDEVQLIIGRISVLDGVVS